VKQAIGAFLKSARTNRGLTQEAAANQAGMSRQQVNRIENGESGTAWSTVEKLVNVYRCNRSDAVEIFTNTDERNLDVRLARQIEPYLMRLCPDRREIAEQLLINQARTIGELLGV
jgi:transcriptional regulator with XRE-family HTH domain